MRRACDRLAGLADLAPAALCPTPAARDALRQWLASTAFPAAYGEAMASTRASGGGCVARVSPDGLRDGEIDIAHIAHAECEQHLFDGLPAGNPRGLKAPLAPLLRAAMDNGRITAELWQGSWTDVGTPERLAQLNMA